MSDLQIETFQEKYLLDYVKLNREWIEKYFKIEEMDLKQLENPYDSILNLGGEIFFVTHGFDVLGVCAMIPHGKNSFELAKMAVDPKARGKGIGDLLMLTAIHWAQGKGANSIMLLSNTILEPAITLYKKHGFKTTHLGPNPEYERCNIEMVLELNP